MASKLALGRRHCLSLESPCAQDLWEAWESFSGDLRTPDLALVYQMVFYYPLLGGAGLAPHALIPQSNSRKDFETASFLEYEKEQMCTSPQSIPSGDVPEGGSTYVTTCRGPP